MVSVILNLVAYRIPEIAGIQPDMVHWVREDEMLVLPHEGMTLVLGKTPTGFASTTVQDVVYFFGDEREADKILVHLDPLAVPSSEWESFLSSVEILEFRELTVSELEASLARSNFRVVHEGDPC